MGTEVDRSSRYRIFLPSGKEDGGTKTNPVLGYRTAGSKAELETGDILFEEMKRLGAFRMCIRIRSAWTAGISTMQCCAIKTVKGKEHEFQLGAYQTEFHTEGFPEVFHGISGPRNGRTV